MRNLELMTLASSEFFEPLSKLDRDPVFRNIAIDLLPESWLVTDFDIWTFARPTVDALVPQGFKIHVSATRANAEDYLHLIVPECIDRKLPFKFVADPRLLTLMNSKNAFRGSSGKFIVIYPRDVDEFKETLEHLYEITQGMAGPYILSDARYRDSKALYYRYGGFWPVSRVEPNGSKTLCIRSPEGDLVPDTRLPYFTLPPWVEDPFANELVTKEPDDAPLHGRYHIEEAITFSNAGGVYKAIDSQTGNTVVLKEARPLSNYWALGSAQGDYLDATRVLEREYRALEKLKGVDGVVQSLDFFQEWEHSFLVEEFVEGLILTRYRALDEFVVIVLDGNPERLPSFCRKFHHLAEQIISILLAVHDRGILLIDVSPNNFLVDLETLEVTLIDLEAAIDRDAPSPGDRIVRHWSTPGFRRDGKPRRRDPQPEDDTYAIGMVLFSLIIPVQGFFELAPDAVEPFLDDLERALELPPEVRRIILLMLDGKARQALDVVASWDPETSANRPLGHDPEVYPWEAWQRSDRTALDHRMEHMFPRIASFLLATYDTQRQDRLWPGDVKVFETNPLGIACGAAGPLLFLKDTAHPLPEDLCQWLERQEFDGDAYANGLYWGLAGIACVLEELGFHTLSRRALDQIDAAEEPFQKSDMFHGAAGIGWAHLWFFLRTGEQGFLDRALAAGNYLLETAEHRDEGCAWRNPSDGLIHYGFAYGASGISLFLLELYQHTRDERFLIIARRGLDFELAGAMDSSAPILRWFNHEEASDISEPYFEHGSAGIGSVFIRFYGLLNEPHYLDVAQRAAAYAFCKFAVMPSQFSGLSGIGELMLDIYLTTGDEVYLNRAYAVAETILNYAVERPQGIGFPGRLLMRLSNDFSSGSSGVGLFLHRLVTRRPRRLLDLATAHKTVPSNVASAAATPHAVVAEHAS